MATYFSILAWRIPLDRGAWWATVHGVAKSDMTEQLNTATGRTQLEENLAKTGVWGEIARSQAVEVEPQKQQDTNTPRMPSLVAQIVKNLPAMRETWVRSLG